MTEPTMEQRRRVARRSVTRDNAYPIQQGGGYFQILIPAAQQPAGLLPPYLPTDYRARDMILDATVRADAMWSAAIGIAITKAAALAWEARSDSQLRSKRAQELLLSADATSISGIGGWVSYMGKQVRNFTCTNGGCFTEIIRATGAYGSRIVGLGHLSSLRMRRTGDPEFPFIYIDRWGRQHVMRWWQVFNLVDMPDPDEAYLGTGLCAAERAYQQIRKLSALEMYLYEKISGSRPLALHIVNGLNKDQLTDMMASASNSQASKGLSLYMGAIVATTLKPDSPPALVTIPLAELPDGFEAAAERERADLIYANALGLDPQDLRPISNQQMGAGAQSEVLSQKAEGRGQAAYRQQLTHMLNQLVFDDKTQFLFTEHDYRDQKAAAEVSAARIGAVTTLVDKQLITNEQGKQILVEMGEIPKALVASGAQAGSDLSDTDKAAVSEPLNNNPGGPPQSTQLPVTSPQAPAPAGTAAPPVEEREHVVERKAAPHRVERRSTHAGARRVLRQIRGGGALSMKAGGGNWVTIDGKPVLIGGGGGGGGAGGGKGKKPAKQYVPKAGGGGSSQYPTLDAFKKGHLTADAAMTQLKKDIKDAKLAGNGKAVNTLTSQYYAIKGANKTATHNAPAVGAKPAATAPKASKPDDTPAIAPMAKKHTQESLVEQAKLDQIGYDLEQAKLGGVSPNMVANIQQHYDAQKAKVEALKVPAGPAKTIHDPDVQAAALKITDGFVNDKIKYGEMEKRLEALGKDTGLSVDELKASAKLLDAQKSASNKLLLAQTADQYGMSPSLLKSAQDLTDQVDQGQITPSQYANKMAKLAQDSGHTATALQDAADTLSSAQAKKNSQVTHAAGGVDPQKAIELAASSSGVSKEAIVQGQKWKDKLDAGEITQAQYDENMKGVGIYHGVTSSQLKGAVADAQGFATTGPSYTPQGKFAAIAGSPIHMHGGGLDDNIKKGIASKGDVDSFHAQADSAMAQAKMKADAAEAAIASSAKLGQTPLPSIVKMQQDAKAEVEAIQAMKAHIDQSVGLYGLSKSPVAKVADQYGISESQLTAAMNVASLHSKGILSTEAMDKNLATMAATAGTTSYDLKMAVLDAHGAQGTTIAASAPQPKAQPKAQPVEFVGGGKLTASQHSLVEQNEKAFAAGEISKYKYDKNMKALQAETGLSKSDLKYWVQQAPAGSSLGKVAHYAGQMQGIKGSVVEEAFKLNQDKISGKIDHNTYDAQLIALAKANQTSSYKLALAVSKTNQQVGLNPAGVNVSNVPGSSYNSGSTPFSSPVSKPAGPKQPFDHMNLEKSNATGKEYYTTNTQSGAHAWAKDAGFDDAWVKSLSSAEKKAMIGYSKHGDQPINNYLRFGKLDSEDAVYESNKPSTVHARIAALDTGLRKHATPTDMTTYRGFSYDKLERAMAEGKLIQGGVFHDAAFVSTAVSSSSSFSGNIKTVIRVPKGSNGAYMVKGNGLSKFDETEFLLPRGANFKILGYKRTNQVFGPKWLLEVEYVGSGDMPAGAFKAEMP